MMNPKKQINYDLFDVVRELPLNKFDNGDRLYILRQRVVNSTWNQIATNISDAMVRKEIDSYA